MQRRESDYSAHYAVDSTFGLLTLRCCREQAANPASGPSSPNGTPSTSISDTPRGVKTAGGRRRDTVITDDTDLAYVDTAQTNARNAEGLRLDRERNARVLSGSSSPTSERPDIQPTRSAPASPDPPPPPFRKRTTEDFDLPPEDTSGLSLLNSTSALDPRFISSNELRGFIRQHKDQLDSLDLDSAEFNALPLEAQFELIQDIRLRSRSTQMDRIENMLAQTKTARDFSLLQLHHLSRRNLITQKQAELVGGKMVTVKNRSGGKGEGAAYVPRRIAGERNREYVLLKNDETGIGWSFKLREVPDEGGSARTEVKVKTEILEEEGSPLEPVSFVDLEPDDQPVSAPKGIAHLGQDSDEDEEFYEIGEEHEARIPRARKGLAYRELSTAKRVRFSEPPKRNNGFASGISGAALTTVVLDGHDDQPGNEVPVAINPAAFVADDESLERVMTRFLEMEANGPSRAGGEGQVSKASGSGTSAKQPMNSVAVDLDSEEEEMWEEVVDLVEKPSGVKPSAPTAPRVSVKLERETFTLPSGVPEQIASFHKTWYGMMTPAVFEEFQSLFPSEIPSDDSGGSGDDEVQITRFKLKKSVGKEMLRLLLLPRGEEGDDEIANALSLARRKLGKMKEEDVETARGECLQWWCTFLDAVDDFRARRNREASDVAETEVASRAVPKRLTVEYLEDDDEDDVVEVLDKAVAAVQGVEKVQPAAPIEVVDLETSAPETSGPPASNPVQRTLGVEKRAETPIEIMDLEEESELEEADPSAAITSDTGTGRPKEAPVELVEDEEELSLTSTRERGRTVSPPRPASPEAFDKQTVPEESPVVIPDDDLSEDQAMEVDDDQEPGFPAEFPMDEAPASPPAPESPPPEPERQDVETNMDAEMADYARFVADLSHKNEDQVRQELEREVRTIRQERGKEQRMSEGVTNDMVEECKELLRLFGLPYIVAPLEAEAQCAKLHELGLVDGIVTDDSDVFLFGGRLVYRNLFNQNKFVECYVASDLEREMTLDREKLIRLAYLLGSDYTDGIKGVGGVLALEILDAFDQIEFRDDDELDGLREFSKFWLRAKVNSLTDADRNTTLKKRLANLCLRVELPDHFPDPQIRDAYINPTTDDSEEAFQWGVPSLDALRDFLQRKLGWPPEKTDEIVIPIIRQFGSYETEGVQQTIDRFFDAEGVQGPTGKVGRLHSSRVQKIMKRWLNRKEGGADESDESGGKGKRKKKKKDTASEGGSSDETPKKKRARAPRKKVSKAVVISDSDEEGGAGKGGDGDGEHEQPPAEDSTSSSSDDEGWLGECVRRVCM